MRSDMLHALQLRIVVRPDELGGSQGETVDEAVEMTKDAIEGYIESMKKHGEAPPEERTVVVTVTVAA